MSKMLIFFISMLPGVCLCLSENIKKKATTCPLDGGRHLQALCRVNRSSQCSCTRMYTAPARSFYTTNHLATDNLKCRKGEQLQKKYTIDADQVYINKNQHKSTFIGHVVATQGASQMTGNKTIVYLNKKNKKVLKIIDYGQPATYTTILKKNKERLNAKAGIIKYYPKKNLISFYSNATIKRSGNSITSDIIHLDLDQEKIFTSNSNKSHNKTLIIIRPKK